MAYKRNDYEKYNYNKIILNNKVVNGGFKKKYKPNEHKVKSKKRIIENKNDNINVLINVDRLITSYEINHNNYIIYDKYYIDIDNQKEKIIKKNR